MVGNGCRVQGLGPASKAFPNKQSPPHPTTHLPMKMESAMPSNNNRHLTPPPRHTACLPFKSRWTNKQSPPHPATHLPMKMETVLPSSDKRHFTPLPTKQRASLSTADGPTSKPSLSAAHLPIKMEPSLPFSTPGHHDGAKPSPIHNTTAHEHGACLYPPPRRTACLPLSSP